MGFEISPYKANVFRNCPLQYKYIYVDKLASFYHKDRPYLVMGDHVHAALKDFMSLVPAPERTYERASGILRQKWARNRKGFASLEEEKRWGERALRMLKDFVTHHDLSITPVWVEDYHSWLASPECKLLGRIDRVDRMNDGRFHIIDYKTGAYHPEETDPLQLYIYALILTRKTQTPVARVSYLFLKGHQWVDFVPTAEATEQSLQELLSWAQKIQDTPEFPATPNRYCGGCDFIEICPKREEALAQMVRQRSELPF